MKKTIGIVGVVALSVFGLSAGAQETPTTPPTTPPVQTWEAKNNPTVDSIAAKYRDKIVAAPAAPGIEKIFPVIGKYESSTNTDAPSVAVSLDATNKGMIWVEGLPQGKIKALLTRSPSTYKIPAQKLEDGKEVAEGTLIYDKEMNTLSISIGKPYNAADPASVFAAPAVVTETETEVSSTGTVKTKTKTKKAKKPEEPKAWVYTGTKVEVATAVVQ